MIPRHGGCHSLQFLGNDIVIASKTPPHASGFHLVKKGHPSLEFLYLKLENDNHLKKNPCSTKLEI